MKQEERRRETETESQIAQHSNIKNKQLKGKDTSFKNGIRFSVTGL